MFFTQVNLHKAKLAAIELHNKLQERNDIALITEPYLFKGKVVGLPKGYDCLMSQAVDQAIRAVVLIPKQFRAVCLTHLSTPDCVVAQVEVAGKKLILASIYMDIKGELPPPGVQKVDKHNYGFILGADSNAHSTLYGPDMNKRGELMEEFLLVNGMMVENVGMTPTFATWRADRWVESHIDVTATKGEVLVQDWEVHEEYNGSDHNTITWRVCEVEAEEELCRPWAKTDWGAFRDRLSKEHLHIPQQITRGGLDEMVYKLYAILNKTLNAVCPLQVKSNKCQANRWYTAQLAEQAKRVRKQYLRAKRTKSNTEKEKYKKMQKKYGKACAKMKPKVWRSYVDAVPNESKMAILDKILQRRASQSIYTLKKADGSYTEPGKETIDLLMSTHFPAAHMQSGEVHEQGDGAVGEGVDEFESEWNDSAQEEVEELVEASSIAGRFKDWITPEKVRTALLEFKPNKAPGPDNLKPIIFKYLPMNIIQYITYIYRCCIATHYTPVMWKKSKVIFIPKPGKDDYRMPKAFRPISLTNFLLKGLERKGSLQRVLSRQ